MGSEPPNLPSSRLSEGGWTLSDEYTETVFEGLGVSVEGRTLVYEDTSLRERIVAAGGADRVWRFFFTSRLDISPSPGFGMASMAKPHVVRESKKQFADELRERGFVDVEREKTESVDLDGQRARLTPYHARLSLEDAEVDIAGSLAVWHDDVFYVVGGAYPESGLERWVDIDAEAYESELLDLIRTVA